MKRNYDFSKGAVIKGKIKSKTQVEEAIKNVQKTLTSIRLDQDVIEAAKKQAEAEGVGYLTWLNSKLRAVVLGEEGLQERVKKLEKAVFKRKAV
jgi:uncharacterized protein (DUF4415 family)